MELRGHFFPPAYFDPSITAVTNFIPSWGASREGDHGGTGIEPMSFRMVGSARNHCATTTHGVYTLMLTSFTQFTWASSKIAKFWTFESSVSKFQSFEPLKVPCPKSKVLNLLEVPFEVTKFWTFENSLLKFWNCHVLPNLLGQRKVRVKFPLYKKKIRIASVYFL